MRCSTLLKSTGMLDVTVVPLMSAIMRRSAVSPNIAEPWPMTIMALSVFIGFTMMSKVKLLPARFISSVVPTESSSKARLVEVDRLFDSGCPSTSKLLMLRR